MSKRHLRTQPAVPDLSCPESNPPLRREWIEDAAALDLYAHSPVWWMKGQRRKHEEER